MSSTLGSLYGFECAPDAKGRCTICRKEQLTARKYRFKLIVGIFFPFALSALDVTIIASALPWIAIDFGQISQMTWIISAFNLCSAAFIPFWSQMCDIFGRTATMEAVLILMMIGSAICTSAPTNAFPLLIFGRAIQGLSVAGINVTTRVIMSDKVSLKGNAKNNSIFGMVGGLSYAIGPVIGGYLTDKTWRWCFGINLPVAATGAILFFVVLRKELLGPQPLPELLAQSGETHKLKARLSTIDFGGQVLFLFGMSLLILGLTWGGARYPWSSPQVIICLILGSFLSITFIIYQSIMAPGRYLSRLIPLQRPTIPWALLSQRNMGLLFYINFCTGMGMIAVLYFVDIYFTFVKLYTPSKAGVQLLYYTPGIGVGVYSAMVMCNIYPRQTFTPLFLGSIIEATGITVLTWALHQGHNATIFGMIALTGAGTGMRFMPNSLHGIGFFPNNIASVIALTSFAVPFVFNNKAGLSASAMEGYTSSISTLSEEAKATIQDAARSGVVWAFISILPLMWLCVLAAGMLGNVRITKKREVDGEGKVDFSENVVESVYLVGWMKRCFRRVESRGSESVVIANHMTV
ncbi:MFS general substrate transporter [Mollisia scopiformis]|uniref:MFS general substrate transporter n=1 Tax=Mollisia scopiformis TaxID=149040 RepID=A0A132B7W2_MOLSC|nr:MFS general substrate transporter [Mollisia scopiformis]KUJ08500.1 MFS general substrate transporter [Mollisia scopiformis]